MTPIEILSATNFKGWKHDVMINLGIMDLDLALREDQPVITPTSTNAQKQKAEKWERSNRVALLFMKKYMNETVRGSIAETDDAKAYLAAIGQKFQESSKAETGNLMMALSKAQFEGEGSVRVHIMKLIDLSKKLSALAIPIPDPFLVHFALESLPDAYSQLKVSYNTQKEKWNVDELIAHCVQEEARLKKEKEKSVLLVIQSGNNKGKAAGSYKRPPYHAKSASPKQNSSSSKGSQNLKPKQTTVFKCFFCKNSGHMKKNCAKYKSWLEKKGLRKPENSK
ncbi:putative transcription factor interactor and regulator CCHC(Zn) family [Rosa chinensis]|uniref:Putative transcription factor interactor and regulator CCHC(Zn) family n=1 Tax=Rosa chinensis TaxID=74649 RepID=A0A2P6QQE3_ROSCH|nr:putative transcription factor interactor and regulator CCHC(Zn) family [Rosa chinensis]